MCASGLNKRRGIYLFVHISWIRTHSTTETVFFLIYLLSTRTKALSMVLMHICIEILFMYVTYLLIVCILVSINTLFLFAFYSSLAHHDSAYCFHSSGWGQRQIGWLVSGVGPSVIDRHSRSEFENRARPDLFFAGWVEEGWQQAVGGGGCPSF